MRKNNFTSILIPVITGAFFVYFLFIRRRMNSWGASPQELEQPLPGDELVPHAQYRTTRGITIQAAPQSVWPWLVQLGAGRAGFYSYDLLENLAGLDIHSARRIVPQWQDLKAGDAVAISPVTPLRVEILQPAASLVLHTVMNPFNAQIVDRQARRDDPWMDWTWGFTLLELPSGAARLLVRVRAEIRPAWLSPLLKWALEPIHFLMEQKMMRGIRSRAEGVQ